MLVDIVFVIVGLLLILYGANWLTDGASSLSLKLSISPIVIGLTVVAFGTSTPELAVSVTSALKGSADIAVGNVIGSNIFNTLMIIGATALCTPIVVSSNTIKKEIPLVIVASLALLLLISDKWLNNASVDLLSRADGLILLLFFTIFLAYVFSIARNSNARSSEEDNIKIMSYTRSGIFIILGLVGLVVGGNMFVGGASSIARTFGVSESIIGLTLVAGGTSLPELATSIVAALKKRPGIAIGNVVGSNLFNIFFVLGTTATITPLKVIGITFIDMCVLVISSILLFVVALCYGNKTINRVEGGIFVILYFCYIIYLIQGV